MADAKLCDRCGEFYMPGNGEKRITLMDEYHNNLMSYRDLCPACFIEFTRFMKSPDYFNEERGEES